MKIATVPMAHLEFLYRHCYRTYCKIAWPSRPNGRWSARNTDDFEKFYATGEWFVPLMEEIKQCCG